MKPPAKLLSHRHRSLTARTHVTLGVWRNASFEHSKVTVDDIVVGVARDATADCALWTNNLLAFACDQHIAKVPCCCVLPRFLAVACCQGSLLLHVAKVPCCCV